MRKIGGVSMNTISSKLTKEKTPQRYCSIQESLRESLKEVKLIKQGKIKAKSWKDLFKELKENKE